MRTLLIASLLLIASGGAAGQPVPTWSPVNAVDLTNVEGMIVHDEDGAGPIEPYLVASGGIASVQPLWSHRRASRGQWLPVDGVAKFDGYRWGPMGGGLYGTAPNAIEYASGFASGSAIEARGAALYGTGTFKLSGGVTTRAFAHWRLDGWSQYRIETGSRRCALFDADAGGPLAAVLVTQIARDGQGPVVGYPAMWNGTTLLVPDGGLSTSPHLPSVYDFVVWDEDGDGPDPARLFIGGDFKQAGSHWARGVCRWDGHHLTALGGGPGVTGGPNGTVDVLEVYDDDGPGPRPAQLYALGTFSSVYQNGSVVPIRILARWDGEQWSGVPGLESMSNKNDMAVFDDDGPGPNREALFIGGLNPTAEGLRRNGIIKWDGQRWHSLGDGLIFPGFVSWASSMCVFDDDGPGPNPGGLYVGGVFHEVAGHEVFGFARWGIPLPEPCFADCDRAGTGYRVLDIFDFLCFQTRFAAGDPYACDADTSTGPRVCDLFDFLFFQNAFAAGCP